MVACWARRQEDEISRPIDPPKRSVTPPMTDSLLRPGAHTAPGFFDSSERRRSAWRGLTPSPGSAEFHVGRPLKIS